MFFEENRYLVDLHQVKKTLRLLAVKVQIKQYHGEGSFIFWLHIQSHQVDVHVIINASLINTYFIIKSDFCSTVG